MKKMEQRIVQGVKIAPIILNHKKKTNKALREKSNLLFVDLINQDFENKNTTTKNN